MGTQRIGGGWLHRVGLCGDLGELQKGRENVIHGELPSVLSLAQELVVSEAGQVT